MVSRKPDAIVLPEDAVLTPLPIDEEISSLSAILLNPFKAKAWLDLSDRKAVGESVEKQRILL